MLVWNFLKHMPKQLLTTTIRITYSSIAHTQRNVVRKLPFHFIMGNGQLIICHRRNLDHFPQSIRNLLITRDFFFCSFNSICWNSGIFIEFHNKYSAIYCVKFTISPVNINHFTAFVCCPTLSRQKYADVLVQSKCCIDYNHSTCIETLNIEMSECDSTIQAMSNRVESERTEPS